MQTTNKYEKTNKQNKAIQIIPHTFMEDTIRHNIAQMASTSKVYISFLIVIIIK